MNVPWMIYGANGYTGRLVAAEAKRRGMTPVLAGRSRAALEKLGDELGLAHKAFPLDGADTARQIDGMRAVLHCAGPFSATSKPMLDACAAASAHYLDITGEIAVFESIFERAAELVTAKIAAIPGVGFDVVPSDCLAAMLSDMMPGADSLVLAMRVRGGMSRGTALTTVESLGRPGWVREGGKLVPVPVAHRTARIPFASGERLATTIPWGDVATACRSTGIADMAFFLATKPSAIRGMRLSRALGPLLRAGVVQRALKSIVARRVTGPDEQARATASVELWGQVTKAGVRRAMRMKTPDGYDVTVAASLAAVARVLDGKVAPGAHTPSRAFGAEFALSLPGISVEKDAPTADV